MAGARVIRARAERGSSRTPIAAARGGHPCARGAGFRRNRLLDGGLGSSVRARSGAHPGAASIRDFGGYPWCAERGLVAPSGRCCTAGHPRACGAGLDDVEHEFDADGLSVRARSGEAGCRVGLRGWRVIPARAGRGVVRSRGASTFRGYPRVCGAGFDDVEYELDADGLSVCARSGAADPLGQWLGPGVICARGAGMLRMAEQVSPSGLSACAELGAMHCNTVRPRPRRVIRIICVRPERGVLRVEPCRLRRGPSCSRRRFVAGCPRRPP